MSGRYTAARPRRAGEAFARTHHGEGAAGAGHDDSVKFDVRNPSALAPDAREDDEVLDADVIGVATGATKRGAVNIDGYDSDSDNETFDKRADARKRKKDAEDVDIIDKLENYDKHLKGEADDDDDDDDDMFGGDDDDNDKNNDKKAASAKKGVRFLHDDDIEGQEDDSKGGGRVHLGNRPGPHDDDDDDDSSSDDEEKIALAIQEEGLDEEVGPGGLKKHAPKLMAFNMRAEQEEGAFDEQGNFVRKAVDPDAQHDRWLDGVSKKQMKRAAEAHDKREAELRATRRADDSVLTGDLLGSLLVRLERGETVLEALARLGQRVKSKPKAKRVPQWKLKKQKGSMDVDEKNDSNEKEKDEKEKDEKEKESDQAKADIEALTDAADKLLNRDYIDIYDMERERLVREYRSETGDEWVDPPKGDDTNDADTNDAAAMWEYRWVDGRDGGVAQGPYDGPTMKAWQDAGYFDGVEFRSAGSNGPWQTSVSFV